MPVYYPPNKEMTMPPTKTMADEWRSYAEKVIPVDASLAQQENARNDFFCGAVALMTLIHRVMGPGKDPSRSEVQQIGDLQKELNAFIDRLQREHH